MERGQALGVVGTAALLAGLVWGCGSGDDGEKEATDGTGGTSGTVSGGTGGAGTGGVGIGGDGTGGDGTGGDGAGGAGTGGGGTGGDSSGGTGGGDTGGAGTGGTPTCTGTWDTSVELLATTSIAQMGTPFDPLTQDDVGPFDWDHKYGKTPELVPLVHDGGVDVLWQDQSSDTTAYVVRATGSGSSFVVERAYSVESLGRIMGMTRDASGNYYVATGVDEDSAITVSYPPDGIHRANIVRVVGFDPDGCVIMESDVDMARDAAASDSELIINPMVAASARLAWGGGQLALVHGNNTEPDASDVRHQKAVTTHINATTGAATRTSSMWVSHSFDQRVFWDGQGFVEMHLGDAYPRSVVLGRYTSNDGRGDYSLFYPKGNTGDNATYTQLGGIAPIANGDWGYMVVLATDRATSIPSSGPSAGAFDVAVLRVSRDFTSQQSGATVVDTSFGETQVVTCAGEQETNHVQWLTDYGSEGANIHANRPRIVAVGSDQFVILWDRWEGADRSSNYVSTWAMTINANGSVVQAAQQVSTSAISRGDDAVALGDSALWVTGDGSGQRLLLNFLTSSLSYVQAPLE